MRRIPEPGGYMVIAYHPVSPNPDGMPNQLRGSLTPIRCDGIYSNAETASEIALAMYSDSLDEDEVILVVQVIEQPKAR